PTSSIVLYSELCPGRRRCRSWPLRATSSSARFAGRATPPPTCRAASTTTPPPPPSGSAAARWRAASTWTSSRRCCSRRSARAGSRPAACRCTSGMRRPTASRCRRSSSDRRPQAEQRRAGGLDGQVRAWVTTPEGDLVCEGPASAGRPAAPSALRGRDLRRVDPGRLRMLKALRPGDLLGDLPVAVKAERQLSLIDHGVMTEPLPWYAGASPWGGPVASPSAVVDLLYSDLLADFRRS